MLAHDGIVAITGKMAAANPRLPGLPDNWRDLVDKHTDTIFVWDRHSMRVDAATGREVPDEKKRVVLYAYRNPRPAAWPKADFIVGNPPFIGVRRLKATIGDGYVETLRAERLRHVLVALGGGVGRKRKSPPIRLHNDKQHHASLLALVEQRIEVHVGTCVEVHAIPSLNGVHVGISPLFAEPPVRVVAAARAAHRRLIFHGVGMVLILPGA